MEEFYFLTLFNRNSRFRYILRLSNELQKKRKAAKTAALVAILILSGSMSVFAGETSKKTHIDALNSLLIQDEVQGRVEPISTYASDLVRKVTKKTTYNGQSALEVLFGMCTDPSHWVNEPIIKVAHEGLAKELGAINDYITFNQLFDSGNNGQYKLAEKVEAAYQKDPSARNQYEKELINMDERVNICNRIFSGEILTIFPVQGHESNKWIAFSGLEPTATAADSKISGMSGMSGMPAGVCPVSGKSGKTSMPATMPENGTNNSSDSTSASKCPMAGMTGMTGTSMADNMSMTATENESGTPAKLLSAYFSAVLTAEKSGDWTEANSALLNLKNYQLLNGGAQLPAKEKVQFEVLYNKLSIFLSLAILYGLLGIILISLHVINILKYNPKVDKYLDKSIYVFAIMFVFYTAGLIMRWYISGHAPWSNGYESMIFVGWAASLSGLVFANRSPITLAITSLLSAIALSVAGMSWMNPEITNLVPVLKSYWLVIHVAVITSSYGFFAMSALLGIFNLGLMIARTNKNRIRLNESIQEFSYIIELSLIVGLFMLTVGTFLGGVWANESWGRYWGWDSKETWALVSILVYSAVIHLRNIPKTNNVLVLNTLSVISFGSIVMTFFGVNYYLSGMHSYGQGTPPPIPVGIYIAMVLLIALIGGAYYSEKKGKHIIK